MSEFSTLLKSALSMNDVSNRSLSQTLNIDRSRFQKILSGERHMTMIHLNLSAPVLQSPKS